MKNNWSAVGEFYLKQTNQFWGRFYTTQILEAIFTQFNFLRPFCFLN